jgi:hypothetical protein
LNAKSAVNARSETIALPPVKWLLIPFAAVAVAATVVQAVRQRTRQPRVRPMSDQWLREHKVMRSD